MFRKYCANTEIVNMEKRVYKEYSVGYLHIEILFIHVYVPIYWLVLRTKASLAANIENGSYFFNTRIVKTRTKETRIRSLYCIRISVFYTLNLRDRFIMKFNLVNFLNVFCIVLNWLSLFMRKIKSAFIVRILHFILIKLSYMWY